MSGSVRRRKAELFRSLCPLSEAAGAGAVHRRPVAERESTRRQGRFTGSCEQRYRPGQDLLEWLVASGQPLASCPARLIRLLASETPRLV